MLITTFHYLPAAHTLANYKLSAGYNNLTLVCITKHCSLKAYCAILVKRSNFCYQTSPRVSTQWQKVELWARNAR